MAASATKEHRATASSGRLDLGRNGQRDRRRTRLRLTRRGRRELAPADYRERGGAFARAAPSLECWVAEKRGRPAAYTKGESIARADDPRQRNAVAPRGARACGSRLEGNRNHVVDCPTNPQQPRPCGGCSRDCSLQQLCYHGASRRAAFPSAGSDRRRWLGCSRLARGRTELVATLSAALAQTSAHRHVG